MSAQYGTPDWVNPQNSTGEAVSEANVDPGVKASATGGQNGQGSVSGKGGCLLCMLSLMNMGLAAMMAALGVLTILEVHKGGVQQQTNDAATDDAVNGGSSSSGGSSRVYHRYDLSEPFLAFYMILFAVLLFIYELMWWTPLTGLNDNMRKNFGFMYGLQGKGLYLIFVAFLCFGLGRDARVLILNYFTGISFLVGGCLHIFIVCSKPEIAQEYQPPGRKSDIVSASDNVV